MFRVGVRTGPNTGVSMPMWIYVLYVVMILLPAYMLYYMAYACYYVAVAIGRGVKNYRQNRNQRQESTS